MFFFVENFSFDFRLRFQWMFDKNSLRFGVFFLFCSIEYCFSCGEDWNFYFYLCFFIVSLLSFLLDSKSNKVSNGLLFWDRDECIPMSVEDIFRVEIFRLLSQIKLIWDILNQCDRLKIVWSIKTIQFQSIWAISVVYHYITAEWMFAIVYFHTGRLSHFIFNFVSKIKSKFMPHIMCVWTTYHCELIYLYWSAYNAICNSQC